ncbi:MAG: alpha/beta hydrolase [Candidatus Methanoplasma sp.]|jgi:pimeloyl-ACP methyl ester carboxylesterase|nr:alpha/beta hydrolase [Candidatus Methanoplasma sp.]
MPYADVNGIDLYYEIEGNGPPLVLVTGFVADVGFWGKASKILSKRFTVIKVDNRGAGKTSYRGRFTLDDIAEDIIFLIKKLDLGMVNILGWSMGSQIALKVAVAAPEIMSKLILVSGYRYRPYRSQYIVRSMLDAADGGTPLEYFARVLNGLCTTEEFFEKKHKAGEDVGWVDLKDLVAVRYQSDAVESSDITDQARKVSVPTLLIHGDKDIMVDCEEGLALADAVPGCKTVLIEGEGHIIPADRYIQYVIEFIEERQI